MSFRAKLLLLFTVSMVAVVALVGAIVSLSLRRAFEKADAQRTSAFVAQFRSEFARRGQEVAARTESIARSDEVLRIAAALARPNPDYAPYVNEAEALAASHQLDFLSLVGADGTLISSAHWPARFGYKEEWLAAEKDRAAQSAFLKREELAEGAALGLFAVRPVKVADAVLFVVGGERLDRPFLESLALPAGMRAMLYRNTEPGFSVAALVTTETVAQPEKLRPLIEQVQRERREFAEVFGWSADPASAETLHLLPLLGRGSEMLGVLIIASSRREIVELERQVLNVAFVVGLVGILAGVLLSRWVAVRISAPVDELADAARQVAKGNWDVRVYNTSADELGEMAAAFNRMTRELSEQRDRLVQAERVAAWRELARRLAHELKNPLFPLQITVENLTRARQLPPEQFEEIFRESTQTLLAELNNLKTIVGRFSDFARMPAPQPQTISLNELAQKVVKLFEPQLQAPGRPPIQAHLELGPGLRPIQADPDLLHRALSNLVLNALDAMPSGGTLTLRTHQRESSVVLEVSDTGAGLTAEECQRLFTPYYTTKQHGTGLGLAIVQSVVSDHHGRITVESEPGRGATFRIELPERMADTLTRGANA